MRLSVKTTAALAMAMSVALGASSALATAPVTVTSGADSGPGSLREALQSGTGIIKVGPMVTEISIDSTLVYAGDEPLRLEGLGQMISANPGADDFTLLEVGNGANLSVSNLNFIGSGGFDFNNPGDGKGIFVAVPGARTGVVRLALTNVSVMGVANHGIHVSDCTLGDDCGAGSGGGGDGSPASVQVILDRVTVDDAGNGRFDADGVRVDERNIGGIVFHANRSSFTNVGADGVELDEGNDGDVFIDVRNSEFNNNGAYCLPAPLDVTEPCVEDDDGELVLDLDDAFDVDEAGNGSLTGTLRNIEGNGNLDEGMDFDEAGPGGVNLDVRRLVGMFNGDEAFKVSAADSGDVFVSMRNVVMTDNGNDGAQIEAEDGDGRVHVIFINSTSMGNEDDGLNLSQENEAAPGTLDIRGFSDVDVLDLDNVDEI